MPEEGSSHGPRPYTQRTLKTIFLRVPWAEWTEITRGNKREFRGSPGAMPTMFSVEVPTPVVAYRKHPAHGYDAQIMILEDHWQEPLGAISAGSLEREGFPDVAHFRRYWMRRERKRFRPTKLVSVYLVRPWENGDERAFADLLLERLYGAFTPG